MKAKAEAEGDPAWQLPVKAEHGHAEDAGHEAEHAHGLHVLDDLDAAAQALNLFQQQGLLGAAPGCSCSLRTTLARPRKRLV